MNKQPLLNRLEHNLLAMQMDDEEPLFILYADTMRDIEGATLHLIIQALVKLVRLGFSKCYFVANGDFPSNVEWKPIDKPTIEGLKRHANAYSEEDLKTYPKYGDYYFQITDKGMIEGAKDIYASYYSES
jgi:hypothetical protein